MAIKQRIQLLLPYEANAVPEGAAVYASLSLTSSFNKEPAGHAFALFAEKQAGLYQEPSEVDDDASEATLPSRGGSMADFVALDEEAMAAEGAKWKGKGKKKKKRKGGDRLDLYDLLGLKHDRWMASADEIKSAYKKAALVHHPDKASEEARPAAEERFKLIQDAYETLSDPTKRREFDSTDDFDDSLPVECASLDFYRVFGAAFRRNARWSVNQPVPEVGDHTTPMAAVDAFYDFWFSFKSWREFPHPDEEDIEAAESREHKRWIERYNSKLREKGKKDEKKRIREFVERAERLDPRILKRKEEERLAKEARKIQKETERLRKVKEEEERIEEAAKRQAAEEAAAAEARKQRQQEKKVLQRERARFRRVCEEAKAPIDHYDVEFVCANSDLESLQSLSFSLSSAMSASDKEEIVVAALDNLKNKEEKGSREKEAAAAAVFAAAERAANEEAAARTAKLDDWNDDEVRMLKKALDKFPPGTSKRWEQVQAYTRTRTVAEITDMVKHGLKTRLAVDGGKEQGFNIVKKRQVNTVIKSEATSRIESFSDVNVDLRGEAVKLVDSGSSVSMNGENDSTWSEVQDLALVKALKCIPKDAADRWDQVAAAVERKKMDCMRRYKEMKASHKARAGK